MIFVIPAKAGIHFASYGLIKSFNYSEFFNRFLLFGPNLDRLLVGLGMPAFAGMTMI